MTVISTDGSPIEPVVIDSLVTSPGERFDVILDAINDPNMSIEFVLHFGLFIQLKLNI